MTAKDVLKKLLSRNWSIIDYHEEVEGEKFGSTGWLINDVTGQQLRFQFYSRGEMQVLEFADRTPKREAGLQ